MITDLDSLIVFTRKLGDTLPELRGSIVITQPGCSADAVNELRKKLVNIPESYLSVIEAVNLNGIAIGYFLLTPSAYKGSDLTEKLISCNDPLQNPFVTNCRKHKVYQVASWEADPIGVVHSDGTFKVGQVVKYNIGNPTSTPVVIADNFEQFLLLAGNLDQIREEYSESGTADWALSRFRLVVTNLALTSSDALSLSWEAIAKVVLC